MSRRTVGADVHLDKEWRGYVVWRGAPMLAKAADELPVGRRLDVRAQVDGQGDWPPTSYPIASAH